MQSMTAAEAKQKFGQLLEKAQRGPVEITKHGRRVGVLHAAEDWYDFDGIEERKNTDLELAEAQAEYEAGKAIPAGEVYSEMRAKIVAAKSKPK